MLAELGPFWGALFLILVVAAGVALTLVGALGIRASRGLRRGTRRAESHA
jgi:hypothetical protein